MNPSQFDTITRLFVTRRTSRRTALATAGAGLVAASLAPVAAQDASPVPAPAGSPVPSDTAGVPFMFVQTFGAGSLAPKDGEAGLLILTADHLAGQTLFFSDRPERVVGMVGTERFLGTGGEGEGLGFTPGDPPNAALVFETSDDQPNQVAVVELIDPTYDPASGQVTYEVRLLEDVDQVDLRLEQAPLTAVEAPQDFTAASLFIDDCPDGSVVCIRTSDNYTVAAYSSGFCWDLGNLCCYPCAANSYPYWDNFCNQNYSDCNGDCQVNYSETWACIT